ncbi:ferredoxin reductase family protein [Demequina aurantiaca]|uniref:ferredoxin reductase family protein n=1 Tax=Demequina aurantiaca TaxID=676200 RepID=UPI003D32AEC7
MSTFAPVGVARPMPPAPPRPSRPERSRRARRPAQPTHRRRFSWLWRDALEAMVWMLCIAAIAFFLASGAFVWTAPIALIEEAGRVTGLVATVLLLVQVALASRAPFIERTIGHDHALVVHGKLGKAAFLLLLAHATLLTISWGAPDGRSIPAQTVYFLTQTKWIGLSVLGLAVFVVVVLTSVTAARRRWPYETWHAIHLLAYVAIALSAPHQFTDGATFVVSSAATWFWIALYTVAFGSLLVWRVIIPVRRVFRNRLTVARIDRHRDGSVSVIMTGRGVDRLNARAGQFILWRFWTRDLWMSANPYSLSASPLAHAMRITVKPLGDHSAALAHLRPGTRVSVAGPYGVFHHGSRVGRGLVLAGAGIGITPVRALLETADPTEPVTVIVRARSQAEAPLLDEVRALCEARGAELYEFYGRRGAGWAPAGFGGTLRDLVPQIQGADLFVCGPVEWADAMAVDAIASGMAQAAVHREKFDW